MLYDLREDSTTKGGTDVYYRGEENPIMRLNPSGVAHWYRVIGQKPLVIIYFTTKSYNPKDPDEKRIPWDDSLIDFNWETEHR